MLCWQDLPSGALEPWTSIQVTNVFNSADNSSNGRRLLQTTAPSYASLDSAGLNLPPVVALPSAHQHMHLLHYRQHHRVKGCSFCCMVQHCHTA